jgi:hypothetical protein
MPDNSSGIPALEPQCTSESSTLTIPIVRRFRNGAERLEKIAIAADL